MLDLTPELSERVLDRLNSEAFTSAWSELLESDDYSYFRSCEGEPFDTDCSDFHRAGRALIDEQLTALSRDARDVAGSHLLGRWLSCADVFTLSASAPRMPDWVNDNIGKRPLTACRIGMTVFWLSGKGRPRWRTRPWEGFGDDPLSRLSYQRKYDTERHGRADALLRAAEEKLWIASDLLAVLAERLQDTDAGGPSTFSWPEIDDIQTDLKRLDLSCGADDLSAMAGRLCFELCAIRQEPGDEKPRIDFAVAEGRYSGALGGYHRRPTGALRPSLSGASLKWMLTQALDELQANVRFIAASGR